MPEIVEETPLAETLEAAEQAARDPEGDVTQEGKQPNEEAATGEQAAAQTEGEQAAATGTEGEVTVQIGDEPSPAKEPAPPWVKELRQRNRELEKEVRRLQATQGTQQQAKVGEKPKLEDFDYDGDKFAVAVEEWTKRKQAAEAEADRLAQAQQQEQVAWNAKLATYGEMKTQLKVKDYDDAEALVQETLNEKQQAVIVKYAKNPALVVYALGKNPGRAKQLAEERDLIQFAMAINDLEKQLKITTRTPAPPSPERRIEASGSKAGSMDSHLEKLREEAERTGDYTKVYAYKRQLANSKAA